MIGGNTQNGYICLYCGGGGGGGGGGGIRLKTTLNCRLYNIPLTLYAW